MLFYDLKISPICFVILQFIKGILSFSFNLRSYKPRVTPAAIWSHLQTQFEHYQWVIAPTQGIRPQGECGRSQEDVGTPSAQGCISLVCLASLTPPAFDLCLMIYSFLLLLSLFSVFFSLYSFLLPLHLFHFHSTTSSYPCLRLFPNQKICLLIMVGSDTGRDHGIRETSHTVFLCSFLLA